MLKVPYPSLALSTPTASIKLTQSIAEGSCPTLENIKNAYGKCVSSKAKAHKDGLDAKDEEKAEELKNAAKKCAAERGEMGTEAFAA